MREAIEAKIISEIPLPMPFWVISSPNHMSSTQPAVSEIAISISLAKVRLPTTLTPPEVLGLEEHHVADGLGEREADGQVARVLGDLLLTDLALLLQALERGHDDRQQLQDDRCRDVGHDSQREERQAGEASSAEQVQEAEDVAVGEVVLDLVDGVGVDPGSRDVRAEPVESEHRRRKRELLPDVRNREGAGDRSQHD